MIHKRCSTGRRISSASSPLLGGGSSSRSSARQPEESLGSIPRHETVVLHNPNPLNNTSPSPICSSSHEKKKHHPTSTTITNNPHSIRVVWPDANVDDVDVDAQHNISSAAAAAVVEPKNSAHEVMDYAVGQALRQHVWSPIALLLGLENHNMYHPNMSLEMAFEVFVAYFARQDVWWRRRQHTNRMTCSNTRDPCGDVIHNGHSSTRDPASLLQNGHRRRHDSSSWLVKRAHVKRATCQSSLVHLNVICHGTNGSRHPEDHIDNGNDGDRPSTHMASSTSLSWWGQEARREQRLAYTSTAWAQQWSHCCTPEVGCDLWCLQQETDHDTTTTTTTNDAPLVLGYMYLERHVILHDCRTTVVRAIRIAPDCYSFDPVEKKEENDTNEMNVNNVHVNGNVNVDLEQEDDPSSTMNYHTSQNEDGLVKELIQELVLFAIQCSVQYGTTHVGVYTEKCPIQEAALDSLFSSVSDNGGGASPFMKYRKERTTHPDGRWLYMTTTTTNNQFNHQTHPRTKDANHNEKDDDTDLRWTILKGAFQRQLQLQSQHLDHESSLLQTQTPSSLPQQQQQQQQPPVDASLLVNDQTSHGNEPPPQQHEGQHQPLPRTDTAIHTHHVMNDQPPSKRPREHNDDTSLRH